MRTPQARPLVPTPSHRFHNSRLRKLVYRVEAPRQALTAATPRTPCAPHTQSFVSGHLFYAPRGRARGTCERVSVACTLHGRPYRSAGCCGPGDRLPSHSRSSRTKYRTCGDHNPCMAATEQSGTKHGIPRQHEPAPIHYPLTNTVCWKRSHGTFHYRVNDRYPP